MLSTKQFARLGLFTVVLVGGGVAGLFAGRAVIDTVVNDEDESPVVVVHDTTAESDLRGSVIDPPLPIGDFSLPSTTGDDFQLSAQKGKVTLIYFGYLTCPDYCPTTMADLQRVYRDLDADEQARVSVVLITVDPERDSIERLTQYVAAFNADFIGARGEEDALQNVMSQFGASALKREVDSALGYLVDHTASVFMLNPDGELMGRFTYGTPYQDILHDVRYVLEHSQG